jgi:insertion element IS1 protein InsB
VGLDCDGCGSRQVVAFHVEDRSSQSATALGEKIPTAYRECALFYTDHYAAYTGIIPSPKHRAISTLARQTNHLARVHCMFRQRVSCVARAPWSCSTKNLANHIGAITDFICHDNLTRYAALEDSTTNKSGQVRGLMPSR